MADVEARLRTLVCDQLGLEPEEVIDAASFRDDLGADSLDAIQLTMATEEEFAIEIDDDQAERLKTFGQLVAHVTAFVEKTGGAA